MYFFGDAGMTSSVAILGLLLCLCKFSSLVPLICFHLLMFGDILVSFSLFHSQTNPAILANTAGAQIPLEDFHSVDVHREDESQTGNPRNTVRDPMENGTEEGKYKHVMQILKEFL